MADTDRVSLLELKIGELETKIRQLNPAGSRLDKLASFSAGSCTNECTAACTIGCTNGCTGSCVTNPVDQVVSTPTPQLSVEAGVAGQQMYERLSKRS